MTLKQIRHALAISIATIFTSIPIAHATPVGTDTLYFHGAVFTLNGEWTENRYLMTYLADFSGFQGEGEPSYLKALDWHWEGSDISSVTLKEAPGGTDQWRTRSLHQIGKGDSLGCESGYSAGAVCTEYLGNPKGFDTLSELTDLRWVFEINFSFKQLRQQNRLLGDGLRAAFVDTSGKLAAPLMACSGAQNPGCPDQPILLSTLSETNGNVPVPGVPALLLAGLAGLFVSRRRQQAGAKN